MLVCKHADGGDRLVPVESTERIQRQQQLFGVDYKPVIRCGAAAVSPLCGLGMLPHGPACLGLGNPRPAWTVFMEVRQEGCHMRSELGLAQALRFSHQRGVEGET